MLLKTIGTKRPRDVHAIKFTKKFASMKPEEFVTFLRHNFSNLKQIHCGANWRFGVDGVGTPKTLEEYGFSVKVSRFSKFDNCVISSTRIRAALSNGEVELANAMLGRRYTVSGQIISGKHIGRKLGAATINIEVSSPLKYGVYVVNTSLGHGVANYGLAPTMGDSAWEVPVLEIHLLNRVGGINLDFSKLKCVRTEFLKFLRPEQKFDTIKALSKQIREDILIANSCF
jgi:riboflavin kinase/FMN adenylyltransferase